MREVLQQVAERERGDEQRRRVGAADRPERHPLHRERRRRSTISDRRRASSERPAAAPASRYERVAADHDQLAVGEVDQAHDPEDQRDPEREQRVEAAEADARRSAFWSEVVSSARGLARPEVGRRRSRRRRQLLAGAGERRSARCAARRCGRRSATARLAFCSTSRIVTPVLAQLRERLEDEVDHDRREAERRLVEQQQARPAEQRAGDRELLLLAAREPAGRAVVVALAGPGSARARARCRRRPSSRSRAVVGPSREVLARP